MTGRDEISDLAAAFGSTAADLKDSQDKLLTYGRGLETLISERTAELAQEKAHLETNVAERTAELSAANEELKSQAAELAKRNQEITLFSKMNDFLQTSTTEAEAYSIISDVVRRVVSATTPAPCSCSTPRAICWRPPRYGARCRRPM